MSMGFQRQTVLIVDDESLVRRGLSRVLSERFALKTARSAEQAFFILGEMTFYAIISDYQMPGRDGIWLLEKARRIQPAMRRVLHSSIIPPGIEDCEESGLVHRYLRKPTRQEELLDALGCDETLVAAPADSDVSDSVAAVV